MTIRERRMIAVDGAMLEIFAHRLRLAVDRFNRMPIRAHLQRIDKPGMRFHVLTPHGAQADLGRLPDTRLIRGAVVARVPEDPRALRHVHRQLVDRPTAGLRQTASPQSCRSGAMQCWEGC